MKKVIVQFNIPGMTAKQYDQAWEDLRAAGESHPIGLLQHVGGHQGSNWVVVEVWESAETFNKYSETLMPILRNLGINISQGKPVITPVHYEYEGAEATVTY
jgi:hypothetical protein